MTANNESQSGITRRFDAEWLHAGAVAALMTLLDCDGEEARIVGGAVRNALLNEPLGDFDIATTAPPAEVIRRARAAGFKAVPTGIEHGTITIVIDDKPFEVTTLREDVETFGRHAKVEFGRNWRRDAERRDFTINALSLSRDGLIHDYVGGLADLEGRRVRFIGEAAKRIAEDYLRILRFFRFHAAYGHGGLPDAEGLSACIGARGGLETLSRERVRMEMLKLMVAKHAVPTIAVMAESGLIETVLGGVALLASFSNMRKLESELAVAPDAVRRLGALGVTVTEDADRLRERLRLANAEHERLHAMADKWWRLSPATDEREARALLYRIGEEKYADRVLLAWSRAWEEGVANSRWDALLRLPQRWRAPAFPLRAADFMSRGVKRGPALGQALRRAEEAWIAAGFPSEREALRRIVDAEAGTPRGPRSAASRDGA